MSDERNGWVPVRFGEAPSPSVSAPSAVNPLRVGMVSLGCPKNLVDGEVMLGRLQRRGHELVADARQADVIVVNTCAFIDRAKQESVDAILEMAREKAAGRAKRLVVTGLPGPALRRRSCARRSPRSTPRWARTRWPTSCRRWRAGRP